MGAKVATGEIAATHEGDGKDLAAKAFGKHWK
jgi:hypothetical protein